MENQVNQGVTSQTVVLFDPQGPNWYNFQDYIPQSGMGLK